MSHWYLLQAKPRQETKAEAELIKQGYKVFLPTIQVEKLSQGKRVYRDEPLFSRYLFVQLNQTTDDWGPIRSTRGVSQLVRLGGQAAHLSEDQLSEIKKLLVAQSTKPMFSVGDSLQVIRGPFKSFLGSLEKIVTLATGEERAMVLLDFLGKSSRLSVELDAVRLAA
jgi:transcriptional antiterminator RfaH